MLTDQQKQKFREDGYLVIPGLIPEPLRQDAINAILDYTKVDLNDSSTWYQPHFEGHGIVPLHHHQAFWNIRQHPPLYEVFRDLYGRDDLWVSTDRASYKPPKAPTTAHWRREAIHWDCDPWTDPPLSIQGLVYLTDTSERQGAFSCVPSIYQNLDKYLDLHKSDDERLKPVASEDQLIPVEGPAGSLVVFNRLMPHTSRLNESDTHRFVQYVTMQPVTTEEHRLHRINEWRSKMPPIWAVRQHIKHQKIPEPGAPAELSALGEKLVGVTPW